MSKRDPNQVFIFNDDELSLIKNTFAENETLLYTVRKVFLQFALTDVEKGLIKMSITPEVQAVLKKRILPKISDEFPLYQLPSILTTLSEQAKVMTPRELAPFIEAKLKVIVYLEQQFNVLASPEQAGSEEIKLENIGRLLGDEHDAFVNLQVYLFLLGYIDPQLGHIRAIAGMKKETIEQQKHRMQRDSSK